jgi:hypothetical protein
MGENFLLKILSPHGDLHIIFNLAIQVGALNQVPCKFLCDFLTEPKFSDQLVMQESNGNLLMLLVLIIPDTMHHKLEAIPFLDLFDLEYDH